MAGIPSIKFIKPNTKKTNTSTTNKNNNNNKNYNSGGGGGGSGGDWDKKATKNQKKTAKNLSSVASYNAGTIKKSLGKQMDIYKISDRQNQRLRDKAIRDSRTASADDWYARQQQLQSATAAVANKAGNALAGSGLGSLRADLRRVDDMGDVETLSTLRENMNTAYSDYFEAASATNNARNAARLEAYEATRNLEADLATQRNNIHGSLFRAPGKAGTKKNGKKAAKPSTQLGSKNFWKKNPLAAALKPQTQGFFR